MGMFDYVNYEANCPKCETKLTNWQTKQYKCSLDTIEPYQVSEFHSYCDNCKTFIVASVDAEVEVIVKRCKVTLSY